MALPPPVALRVPGEVDSPAAMGGDATMGLCEVDPPRTYSRHEFSEQRLVAIAKQLESGKWLTEQRPDLILTYGQARYRAERLMLALRRHGVQGPLEYRTWLGESGHQWAIRAPKE